MRRADGQAVQHKWTVLSLQAPSSQCCHSGMGLDAAEIHHGGPGTCHRVRRMGQGSSSMWYLKVTSEAGLQLAMLCCRMSQSNMQFYWSC